MYSFSFSEQAEPPLIAQARQALRTLKRVTWLTKKLLAPYAYRGASWIMTGVLLVGLNPAVSVQAMNAAGSASDTPSLADFEFSSYEAVTPEDVEATITDDGFAAKPMVVATEMGKPEKELIERQERERQQRERQLQQRQQAQAQIATAAKRKQVAQARPAKSQSSTPVEVAVGGSAGNTYVSGNCTWWAKSKRPDLPNQLGNGGRWLSSAQSKGLSTGQTPKPGAVVVTSEGRVGHVGYVEAVEGDQIIVSDMNMIGRGKVSKRTISADAGVIKGFIY